MPRTTPGPDVIDQLATGVAWLGPDLRIAWANPAFAEQTGFGLSRLAGHTLEALKPAGARLHAFAAQAQADRAPRQLRGIPACAEPGRETQLDWTCTPLAGGALLEVAAAAPAAGAARVSESLRGFAHEVRNPLAAISGAAELLEQRAADARQRELARLIRSESARLAALSERLLGARAATATRAANVHAVLERIGKMLAAERPEVAIARDYDPSLPAWQGDPDRLLQALVNLARNALQAHALRIVLRSRAEAGWRDARGQRVPALRIEVEDDGDGVPPELAATLFEPLVSGHAGGSGLGLALAREIAREHGGDLTYRGLRQGSCFTLWLPRHPRVEIGEVADA